MTEPNRDPLTCRSGRHRWLDAENRRRCCNGYVRVQGASRAELEAEGAEHVVLSGMWRGWKKAD